MKVRCKLCGKVGLAWDTLALKRHMRLMHGISSADGYFEEADEDSIVVLSLGKKEYKKKGIKKTMINKNNQRPDTEKKKKKKKKKGSDEHKSIYWGAVLKSGFETKR